MCIYIGHVEDVVVHSNQAGSVGSVMVEGMLCKAATCSLHAIPCCVHSKGKGGGGGGGGGGLELFVELYTASICTVCA